MVLGYLGFESVCVCGGEQEASARGQFDALQYSFFSVVEDEGGTLERGLEVSCLNCVEGYYNEGGDILESNLYQQVVMLTLK